MQTTMLQRKADSTQGALPSLELLHAVFKADFSRDWRTHRTVCLQHPTGVLMPFLACLFQKASQSKAISVEMHE